MKDSFDIDRLHAQVVFLKMREKTTEELTSMWVQNNQKEWNKDEFAAVQKVLLERLGKLPEQKEIIEKRSGKTSIFNFSFNDKFSIAILIFGLVLFLVGTVFNKIEQHKVSLLNELNQQEAIEAAIKIASMSMPEISGSQVEPSNIHAEKMTLEEAAKRLNTNPQNSFSEASPDTHVWLVSMEGIWFPANVPGVAQKPYQHLSIIIDAKTGLEIFRNLQP